MNHGSRNLIVRWIGLCAAAELLGIGAAAGWYGAINLWIGEPEAIAARVAAWLLLSLAAIPEGVILGGLQALGLRWFFPGVSARRFIVATTALGFVGWGIGSYLPLFVTIDADDASAAEPGVGATAAFAAIFGVAVGTLFGLAQAFALPRALGRRWTWVPANAAGWAVGLPAIYVGAEIGADQTDLAARLALWCLGGLGAGSAIGAATAVSLRAMAAAHDGERRAASEPR